MSMLNSADTYTASEMTDAVIKLPLAPLRYSGLFEEKGVSTTTVALEIKQGKIILVSDQPRGAEPEYLAGRGEKRNTKLLSCTHLPQTDVVTPEDLQDKRAFGTTALTGPVTVINDKLSALKRNVEMTREFHRLGAIKGIVYDADGTTVLHNIFKTFGVQQKKETIAFPATAPENSNPIMAAILSAKRKAEAAMGGNPINRFEAVIGSSFYDMLTGHALILSLSGCACLAERTGAPPPAPRTPGAIATNNWSYVRADGSHVRQNGQWLHIPAAEAGELLLWIEHAEASCRQIYASLYTLLDFHTYQLSNIGSTQCRDGGKSPYSAKHSRLLGKLLNCDI